MSVIFGNSIAMQQKAMDYLWKKQEVTMNNIANAETPGYQEKYVSFEDTFRDCLQEAAGKHSFAEREQMIDGSSIQVKEVSGSSAKLDGNGVDMDAQNVELARTALQYQLLTQSVSSEMARIRSVLK